MVIPPMETVMEIPLPPAMIIPLQTHSLLHCRSMASDGGSAASVASAKNNSGSTDPKPGSSKKVPAMVKPPPKKAPQKIPAEADAAPSNTYKAIVSAKKQKICPPTITGTGPHSVNYDCGSFYNKGDNRVSRAVYKENVATLSVTSMSFNPTSWVCSACPKKHSILGGGAGEGGSSSGGGGGGRTVIVLSDQNFPAVLPTATGNCLAIIRIEHGGCPLCLNHCLLALSF